MLSRSLASVFLAAGAIVGCRQDRPADAAEAPPPPPPAAPTIASYTFTATDYQFSGPTQLPAGIATVRLVNQGKELHHVSIVRLDAGKTFEDFAAAMQQGPGAPPTWVHSVGGPNGVNPGSESNATLVLEPGSYVALCYIPSPDGVPHLAKGMVAKFEVTPATTDSAANAVAAAPAADVVVKLTDYAFDLSTPLKAGKQTIRVENLGPQFHELALFHFAPGKTLADLGAWANGGFKGPPPGEFIGGVSPMDTGKHNVFTVDLAPGEYGFLCFLPDAKDKKEHLAHGMAKQVTVS